MKTVCFGKNAVSRNLKSIKIIKSRVPVNFKPYIPKVAIATAVENKKDVYGKSNSCYPVTVYLVFHTNPCKFRNFQILVKSFFEH